MAKLNKNNFFEVLEYVNKKYPNCSTKELFTLTADIFEDEEGVELTKEEFDDLYDFYQNLDHMEVSF